MNSKTIVLLYLFILQSFRLLVNLAHLRSYKETGLADWASIFIPYYRYTYESIGVAYFFEKKIKCVKNAYLRILRRVEQHK